MRISRIYQKIKIGVENNSIPQTFRINDVADILNKSKAFLSKHSNINKSKQTVYFVKISRGLYKIEDYPYKP